MNLRSLPFGLLALAFIMIHELLVFAKDMFAIGWTPMGLGALFGAWMVGSFCLAMLLTKPIRDAINEESAEEIIQ